MNAQTVVVYTPVQDALYNNGGVIPLLAGLGAGLVCFLLSIYLIGKIFGEKRLNDLVFGSISMLSFAAGLITFCRLAV